ncbi:MAG: hypothetical protein IPK71_36315 [Myxococcales bacterium]|nr:hypothetical protein [Myxococcales bacterium]
MSARRIALALFVATPLVSLGFAACSSEPTTGTPGPDAAAERDATTPPPSDATVDTSAPTGDAAADAPGPADATSDVADAGDARATRCDPTTSFGAPTAVAGLETAIHATFSADELTAYVSVSRGLNEWSLRRAVRASTAAPFVVESIDLVGAPFSAVSGAVSTDGLRVLGHGYQQRDIVYQASRAATSQAFGPTSQATVADLGTYELGAAPTADELEVFYTRTGTNGGLMVAKRASTATPFAAATRVNLQVETESLAVTSDGLTLFATATTGISQMTRPSRAQAFDTLRTVSTEKSPVVWASADGCRLYFGQSYGGAARGIRVASRPRT